MKKAKISPAVAVLPPQPYSAVSEYDRARLKLQNLKQEYEDLLKEAEMKKRKLTTARQRALKLKGEVRFLRRRYKFLIQNASPKNYRPKTYTQSAFNSLEHREKAPKASPVLDLNQISFPEVEAEFPVRSEATESSFTRYLPEEDSGELLKSPICRDAGNDSGRRRKRKVSWQDQVALKV